MSEGGALSKGVTRLRASYICRLGHSRQRAFLLNSGSGKLHSLVEV